MTQPAQRVLDALGITTKRVVSADIRLRVNEMPLVTLECALDPDRFVTQRFRLVPEDDPVPAPFDLDRMCREAMERLRAGIEESHRKAWQDWRLAASYRTWQHE